jgi:[ribosomal protein S5]-alanine N-acetyltransferase
MPHPVTMTGPRLTLCEFTTADAPALHAIYGDPVTTEHLSFEPRTEEQIHALLERIQHSATEQPRVDYTLAIHLANTCELIGTGRLALSTPDVGGPNAGLRPDSPAAQFGLAIHAKHWHNGYGREALKLLVRYAFTELEVADVWGARGPANSASRALMEAAGFSETLIIPNHITKNGVPRDSIVHTLNRADWADQQVG